MKSDSFTDQNGIILYKYSEYPVKIGNSKSNLALCTVWQDVNAVLETHSNLKDQFSIIGNLRSPFGINIILYNLAANPHINEIVIWGHDSLSKTDIGRIGKELLLKLWQRGFDENKRIAGSDFKLINTIESDVLQDIIYNVKINDYSDKKTFNLSVVSNNKIRKAHYFEEFKVEVPDTLPSEDYGYRIREKKASDAYLKLLTYIWKYGKVTSIDAESEDVKEIKDAIVIIEDEDVNDVYLGDWIKKNKNLAIDKLALENYFKTQFSDKLYKKEIFFDVFKFERPKDYSYLYAELLYALPRLPETINSVKYIFDNFGYEAAKKFLLQNLDQKLNTRHKKIIKKVEASKLSEQEKIAILFEVLIPPVNQIDYVINKIKNNEQELDKQIVLWDSRLHTKLQSGRPCLNMISLIVRDKKINLHLFVRSHDVGRAWFFNFYGVAKLLKYIADETNLSAGKITIESQSAHIYKRDWDNIKSIFNEEIMNKNPRMYFDPYKDNDPRGSASILINDGAIKFRLLHPETGEILMELDGKTAKELMYKIKHHEAILDIGNAMFIGSELSKAEMCLKLKIPYFFDQSIKLPTGDQIIP